MYITVALFILKNTIYMYMHVLHAPSLLYHLMLCFVNVLVLFCCVVALFHTSEWYEGDGLMVRDEGQVLAGLVVGLNVVDYNMTLAGEEFDKSVSLRERERVLCVCVFVCLISCVCVRERNNVFVSMYVCVFGVSFGVCHYVWEMERIM